MSVSNATLYIKFSPNTEVKTTDVYLRDVASMECSDKSILNRINTIRLMKVPEGTTGQGRKGKRFVFSSLKVIELIHETYPNLTITPMGATDFIVTCESRKNPSKWINTGKVIGICLITFLGAAFSIMAFNNDAGTTELFRQIYHWATGEVTDGFTIIEITYAIGLGLGITIFFNHIGSRKMSVDPTPMEVQMRLYEDDLNTTLVEAYTRKESYVDVGDSDISGSSGS